jgi:hypothetical protein
MLLSSQIVVKCITNVIPFWTIAAYYISMHMHSITFSNAASFLTLLAVFKICFYSLHKISLQCYQ